VAGFQALVAGLVHGVVVTDHPLPDLSRAAAAESFYAAVRDGLDADLAWVTRDGDRVDDPEHIYPDLFAVARAGLRDRGFEDGTIDDLLAPVERRWTERTTPAAWKRAWVRDRLDDGADLAAAVEATQRDYFGQMSTDAPFVDW
jgi:phytoene dehydrogenase-like protein